VIKAGIGNLHRFGRLAQAADWFDACGGDFVTSDTRGRHG
jgi:hypothetical protein